MKHSVKRKIAVTFIAVMTAALLAIALMNYAFLGTYYTYQKIDTLKQSWKYINRLNAEEAKDIPDSFSQFCATNNLKVLIMNQYLSQKIYANTIDSDVMKLRLAGILLGEEDQNTRILEEKSSYQIQNFHEITLNMDYLQLVGRLSNGCYYMVQCPSESISDAAQISNQFYTYVGLAAVLAKEQAHFCLIFGTFRACSPPKQQEQAH